MIRIASITVVLIALCSAFLYKTRTPLPNTAIMQGRDKNTYTSTQWIQAGNRLILIDQAMQDRISPKDQITDILVDQLAHTARVITIENAGHALLAQQPQAIAQKQLYVFNDPEARNAVGIRGDNILKDYDRCLNYIETLS